MNNAKRITNTLIAVNEKRPKLRRFIGKVSIKYGGERHKEVERFLKFAFVGVVGTFVDLGIFTTLTKFVFPVTAANAGTSILISATIAFLAAVVNNFIWNRYWTYPDSRSHSIWLQFGQFLLVNMGGLVIRVLVLAAMSPTFSLLIGSIRDNFLLGWSLSKDLQAALGGDVALLSSIVIVLFWNFFVNRYWTYNDVK